MEAHLSLRSATLNNDYYEIIKHDGKFGSEIFELARDKAYEELQGSQISVFVTIDDAYVYVGCWLNVAYFVSQNELPKQFALTKRVGNNETKSCVTFRIGIEELKRFVNEEAVIREEDFLNVWKSVIGENVWEAPQGEPYYVMGINRVRIEIKQDVGGRPYYDKLLEAGEEKKILSIPSRKQAYSVISGIVNNIARWNIRDYTFIAYVPFAINKKIDLNSTLYLNSYDKKRKVVKKLSALCRKQKYGFEKEALKEIAEAGRCNYFTARELLIKIASVVKSKKISAETCIRFFDKQGVGYDGFTKQDVTALRLLKERVQIPEIMKILNMDEVRFDNQILNFLLGGKYVHSNGKVFKVTDKGNEILLSNEILSTIK